MKIKEAYEYGIQILTDAGINDAKSDTLLLLHYICHIERGDLYAHGDRILEDNLNEKYVEALKRRVLHEPLQHITGFQEFMGLEFCVNNCVLVPRQDTEILVEEVLKNLQDGSRILDMCTGSGCILLSLLHYSNNCEGIGVDISDEALEIATQNADRLDLGATFIKSNLFDSMDGKFDFIVSNPPYIRSEVIPTLMEEVKDFEPIIALDGKEDGLYFYRQIIESGKNYLQRGGMLYFEIGFDQAVDVSALMKDAGFQDIVIVKDYALFDRVVFGTFMEEI